MKKTAVPILVAMVASLVAVPASWAAGQAQTPAELSSQCQTAVKKNPNNDTGKLCQEGIDLQKQGKNDEAVAKMKQGLAAAKGHKK